ncbi:MAG: hypothetical protein JOZ54_25265 [Acidobacteria bacterium]|nr:hypothetical protein [Acidobacteriota bacterium]
MKVTVEELRERLDDVLAQVEQGNAVDVYSGEKKVATIDPPEAPAKPIPRLGDYRPIPLPEPIDFDPLDLLMEDRRKR